jgi:hypothetical protein
MHCVGSENMMWIVKHNTGIRKDWKMEAGPWSSAQVLGKEEIEGY